MSVRRYLVWPSDRLPLFALAAALWLALVATTVVRAGRLGTVTMVAIAMFAFLGALNLAMGHYWMAASMGCFGLSDALWNLSGGPQVSYMSGVSAGLMVAGLVAIGLSIRSDEVARFAERASET